MSLQNDTIANNKPTSVGDHPTKTARQIAAEQIRRNSPILVGVVPCLEIVFPDPKTRPGKRTFLEWKSRKYFPSVKIGKRVFLDPIEVRKALDKRFTIEAID